MSESSYIRLSQRYCHECSTIIAISEPAVQVGQKAYHADCHKKPRRSTPTAKEEPKAEVVPLSVLTARTSIM